VIRRHKTLLGLIACGSLLLLGATTLLNLSTQTYGAVSNAEIPNGLNNANSAQQSQVVVSGTAYYVTSSNLNLPATLVNGIAVNTTLSWRTCLTKTAAGTGTFQIVIYMGTHGSISDTAEVSQSVGTQTAAADTMCADVKLTFTAVGASTGSFFWSITPLHQQATSTGFGLNTTTGAFTGTVSSLDTQTASLIFGLGFISTTGTPTITVPLVEARAFNLD
jgi:hypothetical protein